MSLNVCACMVPIAPSRSPCIRIRACTTYPVRNNDDFNCLYEHAAFNYVMLMPYTNMHVNVFPSLFVFEYA